MPTIEISVETYEKLQRLGRAFVDTPETVIARLANAALAADSSRVRSVPGADDVIVVDPLFTGNLAHTRVRRATFGSIEVDPPQWNQLLRLAHLEASRGLGSFAAVKAATTARIREGRYDKEGYKYVAEAGFSIQGLDSNLAWASSLRLAKRLRVPLEVEFEWLVKEGAAHPGKRGHMRWEPAP